MTSSRLLFAIPALKVGRAYEFASSVNRVSVWKSLRLPESTFEQKLLQRRWLGVGILSNQLGKQICVVCSLFRNCEIAQLFSPVFLLPEEN
jgi:hypothetical protein